MDGFLLACGGARRRRNGLLGRCLDEARCGWSLVGLQLGRGVRTGSNSSGQDATAFQLDQSPQDGKPECGAIRMALLAPLDKIG